MNRSRIFLADGRHDALESLVGTVPSQRLPGSVVHQVGNRVQRILVMHRQIGALGQELAQQSVGVLATALLPRTVRIAKVHLHARGLTERLVPRHLSALVVGERFTQGRSHRIELGRERRQRTFCRAALHLAQQHKTRCTLHQHTDRRLIARTLDQIALPVPGHQAIFDLGRTHMDTHHVRDLPSSILARRAGPARALALAQQGDELAAQLPAWVGVDGVVDRLVRDVPGGLIGMHAPECAGNLLWRPAPTEQRADRLPQSTVGM